MTTFGCFYRGKTRTYNLFASLPLRIHDALFSIQFIVYEPTFFSPSIPSRRCATTNCSKREVTCHCDTIYGSLVDVILYISRYCSLFGPTISILAPLTITVLIIELRTEKIDKFYALWRWSLMLSVTVTRNPWNVVGERRREIRQRIERCAGNLADYFRSVNGSEVNDVEKLFEFHRRCQRQRRGGSTKLIPTC